jgi:hypothetical protein
MGPLQWVVNRDQSTSQAADRSACRAPLLQSHVGANTLRKILSANLSKFQMAV